MKHDDIAGSLGKIFSLKYILFNTFDTSPLQLELNKTQERVLMMTWHHPGATMQFLSREAGLEKGSLTTVIDSLEADGLVFRRRDERDKRSFTVMTTEEGVLLAERIESLFREHLDVLLAKLSPEERTAFANAVQTMNRIIPVLAS